MTFSHAKGKYRKPNITYAKYLAIDAHYFTAVHNAVASKPTSRKQIVVIAAPKAMYRSSLN